MQQEVSAYDGFELLCSELSLSWEELNARIAEDAQAVLDRVKTLELDAMALPLAKNLHLKGSETPFITSGTDLSRHFAKLIQQMERGAAFEAPPMIAPTDEITAFLQKKVGSSFNRLVNKVVGSLRIGNLGQAYDRDRELKKVARHFGECISRYLSKPVLLTRFLNLFVGDGPLDLVENGTHCAFVAMAALRIHRRFSRMASDACRERLLEMGLIMLFQDIACLVDGIEHDRADPNHARRSADLARQIGLPASCVTAIGHHHRCQDENGAPILRSQTPTVFESMATVVNAFVHCLSADELGLELNQALYVLSHYAERGYFAPDCLKALGRISIGERKQRIISKALEFRALCPDEGHPVLWDVRTAVPNRFICQKLSCEHITNEEVIVYQTVGFGGPADGIHIPRGRYCKCAYLTRRFHVWLLKLLQGAESFRTGTS